MIARIWRGWTATESADEVAVALRDGIVARYSVTPGNLAAQILRRPLAGGVELMVWSLWESEHAVPATIEESHRLLVARDTVCAMWDLVPDAPAVAAAAA
jgi:hypothetical protein